MSSPTPSDLQALAAAVAARQDREAFTTLFDYFAPRIKSYLMRLGADAGLADEMTQDVMLVLWRKAGLFDPARSSLRTWLYRVARNRRIDVMRRDRVDYHDPSEFMFEIADPGITDAGTQIDTLSREQLLRSAVERLPEDQAALINLAFFDDLSHSAIAERTGLPLGTVKSRIRLAFSRLRRQLEIDGISSPV